MLPHSLFSMASSIAKSVVSGFHRSTHGTRGPPHACGPPPVQIKAQDDSSSAPCATDPPCGNTSSGIVPPRSRGVNSPDADICPITTVASAASVVFSFIYPVVGAAAYADDDPGCPVPIYNAMVTSGYAASIMAVTISVYTSGGPICAAPACGVAVTPGHDLSISGAAISTYGVVTTPGHVDSPVGAPCAPSFVCSSADATITASGTPLVGAMAVLAPLPLSAA